MFQGSCHLLSLLKTALKEDLPMWVRTGIEKKLCFVEGRTFPVVDLDDFLFPD
jgi:hypothetical protein